MLPYILSGLRKFFSVTELNLQARKLSTPANTKPAAAEPPSQRASVAVTPTSPMAVTPISDVSQMAAEVARRAQPNKVVKEKDNKPKEIMIKSASSSKVQAPPAPPATSSKPKTPSPLPETKKATVESLTITTTTTSSSSSNQKPTSPTTKSGGNTTPVPKIGTVKSNDFLALAEKARQDYLRKIGSNSDLKGSATLDNRKSTPVIMSTSTLPKAATSRPQSTMIEVKPAVTTNNPVNVTSVRDHMNKFESAQSNGKNYELSGVTEDHSHTEASLSNGTLRGNKPYGHNGVHTDVLAPPSSFKDERTRGDTTHIDIIPPPPSFAADAAGGDGLDSGPAFGADDAASFVSSVSSLSTLSSEHGESTRVPHHYDDIIVPPPPPPEFDDHTHTNTTENAYEEIPGTFIPPPVQFTGNNNNNNNNSKGSGERAFQRKPVDLWQNGDVQDWLDSLEMGQYKHSFARNAVDGSKLTALERNDYIELGVTQVGHRMDMQRSIKRLMLRNSPAS
jgi:SH3/ankyrin repeat-containing protein